jgi:hypothetical protein
MVAKTFTTEFSIAGARTASAARAVDAGSVAALKMHDTEKHANASRLKRVMFDFGLYRPSTEKASRVLPELTYTVPFTIVAPPRSSGPPPALIPFLV